MLEAHDGIARLRADWDQIARNYDIIVTPSAVDEAPEGLKDTGIAVSPLEYLKRHIFDVLILLVGILHYVDYPSRSRHERARIQRKMRTPDWSYRRRLSLQRHGRSPKW